MFLSIQHTKVRKKKKEKESKKHTISWKRCIIIFIWLFWKPHILCNDSNDSFNGAKKFSTFDNDGCCNSTEKISICWHWGHCFSAKLWKRKQIYFYIQYEHIFIAWVIFIILCCLLLPCCMHPLQYMWPHWVKQNGFFPLCGVAKHLLHINISISVKKNKQRLYFTFE